MVRFQTSSNGAGVGALSEFFYAALLGEQVGQPFAGMRVAGVGALPEFLDMTLVGQVGAFIGAWGMADALARLLGNLLSGAVRDSVKRLTHDDAAGYVTVFLLEALALGVSLLLLRRISVDRFRAGDTAGDDLLAIAEQLGSS